MDLVQTIALPSVLGGLRGVLEGAQEDLQRYAVAIATDLTSAATSGSERDVEEVIGQSEALLEINRLRVSRAQEQIFRGIVRGIATTLVTLATSGIVRGLDRLPQEEP